MNRFKHLIIGVAVMAAGFTASGLMATAPVSADHKDGHKCTRTFLTIQPWYRGLPLEAENCSIKQPDTSSDKNAVSKFIFTIVLNVIEIVLQIIGYAAVGFIIYGGFKYLTSAGSADRITSGRKIIQNALIGLVISFMSVGIVNLVVTNIAPDNQLNCPAGTATSVDGKINAECAGISTVGDEKALAGILNAVYYAAGAAAIIVIIVSSIFYIISQGDAAKIKRAKDGILYAVVGLVVILLAFVITNFIIGRF